MAPVASGERLGLTEAVLQAAQWHPSIAEAIGNLYKQGEGINVARAGYYPQISGGIRTGYDTGYGGDRNSQALNLSLKQMLYDFGPRPISYWWWTTLPVTLPMPGSKPAATNS